MHASLHIVLSYIPSSALKSKPMGLLINIYNAKHSMTHHLISWRAVFVKTHCRLSDAHVHTLQNRGMYIWQITCMQGQVSVYCTPYLSLYYAYLKCVMHTFLFSAEFEFATTTRRAIAYHSLLLLYSHQKQRFCLHECTLPPSCFLL